MNSVDEQKSIKTLIIFDYEQKMRKGSIFEVSETVLNSVLDYNM